MYEAYRDPDCRTAARPRRPPMTPVSVGLVAAILLGVAGVAVHHQFWTARRARLQTEADAFGGRLDDRE